MKKFKIIENIKKLQEIPINTAWLNTGQKNLQSFMAENPVRNFEPDRHSWQEGIFKKLILKPMPIAIIAIIVSLITGSGVVTASQNSLPTDRLYPVKLIMEKVEEATTFDGVKKIELQTKLAKNRLEEIKQLQANGQATKLIVENSLQQYESNLAKAQAYLTAASDNKEIPSSRVMAASNNLERAVASQQATMVTIEAKAPVEYKLVLSKGRENIVSASDISAKKISTTINQSDQREQVIPASQITFSTSTAQSGSSISLTSDTSAQLKIDVISKEEALEIAKKSGLAKGIKGWKAELYWYYGKINNYVWAVSNDLSEFNGQTVIINAKSGEVYQISNYQTLNNPVTPNVTPPVIVTPTVIIPPTVKITPKPITCPEYINCKLSFVNESPGSNESEIVATSSCQIPVGCERTTKIVY